MNFNCIKKKILKVIIIFLILLLINEFIQGYYRHKNRSYIFQLARERSNITNKPLIIVGDPHNGTGSNLYGMLLGYGYSVEKDDILIDLEPCNKCINKPNTIKGDLKEILKEFKNDSYIIYISCTLEYIENIEDTLSEIYRVSGNNKNLFINHIQSNTISSYFYLHKDKVFNRIFCAPPQSDKVIYEKLK
jgi:hypothetical protein